MKFIITESELFSIRLWYRRHYLAIIFIKLLKNSIIIQECIYFVNLINTFDNRHRNAFGSPNEMLSAIWFQQKIKAAVRALIFTFFIFSVAQNRIASYLWFVLISFFVILYPIFTDLDVREEFHFQNRVGAFIHRVFKIETLVKSWLIPDLLFADAGFFVASSIGEAQKLVIRFSQSSNAFGFKISMKLQNLFISQGTLLNKWKL